MAKGQRICIALACVASLIEGLTVAQEEQSVYHEYVVIGAGPAGLQYSWYLHTAGKDYVTLEKGANAGGSFHKVPRWRKLISINKVHLDRANLDFNLRHDWNSLLSDPSHMMARKLSSDPKIVEHLFPTLLMSSHHSNRSRDEIHSTGDRSKRDFDYAELAHMCCTEGVFRQKNARRTATEYTSRCDNLPHWMHGCLSPSDSRLDVANFTRGMLMRHFTEDFYPKADVLVDYLVSFASLTSLHIKFNTAVSSIDKAEEVPSNLNQSSGVRYKILTDTGQVYFCKTLVIAVGLSKAVQPDMFEGGDLLYTYDSAPTNLTIYKGKKILIIGRGNGAMEFADNIMEVAAYVHLLGGIHRRLRLAWESHYPGDLRAVHNKILESYQLKTLDALIETPLEQVSFEKFEKQQIIESRRRQQFSFPFRSSTQSIVKASSSKFIEPVLKETMDMFRDGITQMPKSSIKAQLRLAAASYTSGTVKHIQDGIAGQMHIDNYTETMDQPVDYSALRSRPLKTINGEFEIVGHNMFDHPPSEDGKFYQHPRSSYDIVIACLGWKFDTSIFNQSVSPELDHAKKFPIITPQYESVNNKGMYFVGAASHSIDARVAAGGFVHGYRYTARALHRMEEEMSSIDAGELETMWPVHMVQAKVSAQEVQQPRMLDRLITRIQHRLNHASGTYQMFNGYLQDVVLYEPVEHAELEPQKYSFDTPEDSDVSLPWFDSGDPVEAVTRAWVEGDLAQNTSSFTGLRMFYFEEVPVHAIPLLVRRWAYRLFGEAIVRQNLCTNILNISGKIDCVLDYYNGIRYSTIYLEYSPEWSIANGSRDPFKTARVLGSADKPEKSGFLHPTMKTFDSRLENKEGFTTKVLEGLHSAGVRSPIKTDSPSHHEAAESELEEEEDSGTSKASEADTDPFGVGAAPHRETNSSSHRDSREFFYGNLSVQFRTPTYSDAIFEDFSAEFYTYWKATRPLQRFFVESFRRHALTHALSAISKPPGSGGVSDKEDLLDGTAQVLFAHGTDNQRYLLDHIDSLQDPSWTNHSIVFVDTVTALRWPCGAQIEYALRGRFFGAGHGFSRRRSFRDLTKLSSSLFGVTAVVAGKPGLSSDIYPIARQISERYPETVHYVLECGYYGDDENPLEATSLEAEVNETTVELWLNRQQTLTLGMDTLEIDTPLFRCDETASAVLACDADVCGAMPLAAFVDERLETMPENPSAKEIISELVLPCMEFLMKSCLAEESDSDLN
eukprot:gb/GECG01013458.1/.p1 GENE.gb/GECG01013458.1/~~gb/GECG01013458.1/.p1  ORF type:complete len:1237 (+),score=155.11 gb/GECG01013458.1/:1-3711(+)